MQTRSTLEVPPAVLHVGIYEITRLYVSTNQTWLLLGSSLLCCPSITAQALRATMVAAELPLRGKLRAKATTISIDQRILEVLYQRLHALFCTTPNCPVLDPWAKLQRQTARVLLGACVRPRIRRRALRGPSLDSRTFPIVALRAVRLPLVELAISG